MSRKHASHPDIVRHLKRAHGHLASVVAMIEEGRPCLDLALQIHAVENAVANAKRELIHDHIEHCLEVPGEASGIGGAGDLARTQGSDEVPVR